jgi:hypothetical protein
VTRGQEADGYRLEIDYDDARWLRVPDPEVMDHGTWAERSAKAWADDLGRHDRNWEQVLRLMLMTAAGQPYSVEPDALLLHVLTPPDEAPDVAIAVVLSMPSDGESAADTAAQLVEAAAGTAVEPPTVQQLTLSTSAPATLVTVHRRDADGALQTEVRLLWLVHPEVLATLTAAAEDIGRVLSMRDDLVGLAGRIGLHLVGGTG